MQFKSTQHLNLYLLFATLFVTALVVCNLIANKFITINLGFLGFTSPFVISAGVLPYPITFLITDLLSEYFGRKATNKVVILGLVASVFVLFILYLGGQFNAIENSPVSDSLYNAMFGNSWRVIAASMCAYLVAQLVDVRLFHFWKTLTNGKHLWLRNNASTIISQLVDTTLVVCVLFLGVLELNTLLGYIVDGWLFKVLCALVDTPIIYGIVYILKRFFNISPQKV